MGCNGSIWDESTGNSSEGCCGLLKSFDQVAKYLYLLQPISYLSQLEIEEWRVCVWRSPTSFSIVFQSKPKYLCAMRYAGISAVGMFDSNGTQLLVMRNAPQSAKVKNVKYLVETFLTYELNKIKNDFTSDEMCDIFRRY